MPASARLATAGDCCAMYYAFFRYRPLALPSMTTTEEELMHQLTYYTLEHARSDRRFLHQHIVDAYGAQTADRTTKPIRIVFSLIGLHLHLERGYTGRQVQLAHMALARRRRSWPSLPLPAERGG